MPVATIHLFSLAERSELPSLLHFIKDSHVKPLVLSKPIRWIIRPEHIDVDSLLRPTWDLLVIVEDNKASQDLIASITQTSPNPNSTSTSASNTSKHSFRVQQHYSFSTGIPSRLTRDFNTRINPTLLHPDSSSIPELTGALDKPLHLHDSSQTLALSAELHSWITGGADGARISPSSLPVAGAVSMLNLLSFRPGPAMKESYLKYGAAFGETIGAKRGGNAKLVGNIIHSSPNPSESSSQTRSPVGAASNADRQDIIWHEFALAHYPTLLHFADMLASEDYQSVNRMYRVPALADTCILCTSELEIEKILNGGGEVQAKL